MPPSSLGLRLFRTAVIGVQLEQTKTFRQNSTRLDPLSVESLTPRTSTYSTLRYELWKLERPSGLFKLHSSVFVFLRAWAEVQKSPHGSVLEPEGPTRAHAKSKIVEWHLTSPLCLSIPVRTSQALERVQRTTDSPGTTRRPGRHRGARSVRRESDANRITFIYTISLGAARFTFLRENERVNRIITL